LLSGGTVVTHRDLLKRNNSQNYHRFLRICPFHTSKKISRTEQHIFMQAMTHLPNFGVEEMKSGCLQLTQIRILIIWWQLTCLMRKLLMQTSIELEHIWLRMLIEQVVHLSRKAISILLLICYQVFTLPFSSSCILLQIYI